MREITQLRDNRMTLRAAFMQVIQQEDLNFLLTNRIPRLWLTLFMGWFSKIELPLIRTLSIGIWRRFWSPAFACILSMSCCT